jgi:hypothetical protein
MNPDETVLDDVTRRTIGGAQTVSSALGAGFIEKAHEMRWRMSFARAASRSRSTTPSPSVTMG